MSKFRLNVWMIAAVVSVFGWAGCTAEQTEEGRAPDVDVEVDPGRWPEYQVNWADVDVGTTQRNVSVPVVKVEKEQRQVSVPFIDINPPGAGEREERTVAMEVEVPHSGYNLEITEIRAAGDDLWVIGTLRETGDMSAQVMTRVSDQVVVNAPEGLDVRKVIVGERPEGVYNQQYRFVSSMNVLSEQIPQGARVIYQRES